MIRLKLRLKFFLLMRKLCTKKLLKLKHLSILVSISKKVYISNGELIYSLVLYILKKEVIFWDVKGVIPVVQQSAGYALRWRSTLACVYDIKIVSIIIFYIFRSLGKLLSWQKYTQNDSLKCTVKECWKICSH